MISWRMAAGWLVALLAATALTWQIVGLADSQVGESPMALAPMLTTENTTSITATTSTTTSPSTSESRRATSTTESATTSSSGSPTPTSSSPTSTSSSTSSTAWSIWNVTTTGGVVVVRYRPGEVELQAATPAPGYAVEIDDPGPPRVRVEFAGGGDEVRVEARWDSGRLDIDVDRD